MSAPEEIRGARVVLRAVTPEDADALTRVLAAPEVRRWWGGQTVEEAVGRLVEQPATSLVVVAEGQVAGCLARPKIV